MRVAVAFLLMGLAATAAQDAAQFSGRLSVLPVDFATYQRLSGSGEVQAALSGRLLDVSGGFKGLSSSATAAHVHQAPPGRRGPPVFTIEVTEARDGRLTGQVDLDGDQVEALRAGELYVQIHTENNPEGEIRGWLASVW